MSQRSEQDEGFLERRIPVKWVVLGVTALVVVMAVVLLVVFLVDRSRDQARLAEAAAMTASTDVTSPYDFSELPVDVDLDVVEDAAFVSLLLVDDQGSMTGYGIKSDRPAAQALAEAVREADEVDSDIAASVTATTTDLEGGGQVLGSTMTFVFPDRGTLTFTLDLDHGLIVREERVWQPAGDLEALVEAAVSGTP